MGQRAWTECTETRRPCPIKVGPEETLLPPEWDQRRLASSGCGQRRPHLSKVDPRTNS